VWRRSVAACWLFAFSTGAVFVPRAALAESQLVATANSWGQNPDPDYGPDYNGGDFTRPENNFETRFEYRSSGTTARSEEQTLVLRWNGAIKLDTGWKFAWLTELPLAAQTTDPTPTNLGGQQLGNGDLVVQAALSRPIDQRWAYGLGARLVAPTAAEPGLGAGQWQLLPGFGIRYSFLELDDTYFAPKMRYDFGFAAEPSRRVRNEAQFAPTFNIGLPERWFVTLYPSYDIRINYGQAASGQTGRLFLPFNASVGRLLTDKLEASVEVGVPIIDAYPVYNFKIELRMAYKL
jgi:hypothetical protein